MILIKLNQRQTRQLRKHMAMVHTAARVGQRGVFCAQIHHDTGDKTAYVRGQFFHGKYGDMIYNAVKAARAPFGYAGIPPRRSAFTSTPHQEAK